MTAGAPLPASNDEADLARLTEIIRANSFGREEVMLVSLRPSSYYFDMKPSTLNLEGAFVIAKLLFKRCRAAVAAFVGGLEMEAVPITGWVVTFSQQQGGPIAGFFVRKAAKEHGARERGESHRLLGRSRASASDP